MAGIKSYLFCSMFKCKSEKYWQQPVTGIRFYPFLSHCSSCWNVFVYFLYHRLWIKFVTSP